MKDASKKEVEKLKDETEVVIDAEENSKSTTPSDADSIDVLYAKEQRKSRLLLISSVVFLSLFLVTLGFGLRAAKGDGGNDRHGSQYRSMHDRFEKHGPRSPDYR